MLLKTKETLEALGALALWTLLLLLGALKPLLPRRTMPSILAPDYQMLCLGPVMRSDRTMRII